MGDRALSVKLNFHPWNYAGILWKPGDIINQLITELGLRGGVRMDLFDDMLI